MAELLRQRAAIATAAVQATPEHREMVAWLVEATDDASPLVRSEVAVALSRFASTHCLAFQVRHLVASLESRNTLAFVGAYAEGRLEDTSTQLRYIHH